jgi:hypothetical protein
MGVGINIEPFSSLTRFDVAWSTSTMFIVNKQEPIELRYAASL